MRLLEYLLWLLYPPKCVLCGHLLAGEETDLCHRCRVETPAVSQRRAKLRYLNSWTALWYYEGEVRKSLLRYKFYRAQTKGEVFGRLLAMRVSRDYPKGFDLLTWVPISAKRLRKRGYDQVELIARSLGRELGMEPVSCVTKIRDNPPQSRMADPAARRANVLGAYRVDKPALVTGKRVLLIDDIITTGATVGECARVLLTAGAESVTCAAVAAARKSKPDR